MKKEMTSSKPVYPGRDMGFIPKIWHGKSTAEPSQRARGVYRGDFRVRTLRSIKRR